MKDYAVSCTSKLINCAVAIYILKLLGMATSHVTSAAATNAASNVAPMVLTLARGDWVITTAVGIVTALASFWKCSTQNAGV